MRSSGRGCGSARTPGSAPTPWSTAARPSVRATGSSRSRASGRVPQDLKYRGEPSTLAIGDANIVREYVSINPGTEGGGMETRHRERLSLHGVLARRARLPARRLRHPRQRRRARRSRDRRGPRHRRRPGGRAPVRAPRRVGAVRGRRDGVEGRPAVLHGGGRPGAPVRPERHRSPPARLPGRDHPRACAGRIGSSSSAAAAAWSTSPRSRAELGHVPEVERMVAFVADSQRGVCR